MDTSRFAREEQAGQRSRSAAELIADGVTHDQLRGPHWRRTTYGFYAPALEGEPTTGQRLLDVEPLLADDCALSAWAAAYVHGVDWMDGKNPRTGKELRIIISSGRAKRRRSSIVSYRTSRLSPDDVVRRYGLTVTHPLRTAVDGARWAPNQEESLVFLDAMLAYQVVDLSDLRCYLEQPLGLAGRERARAVAALAQPGVRSPWESRLRLCYELTAGLPRPLVNAPIFGPNDEFLGIPDLFDPEAGLATEYDGQYHLQRWQRRDDTIREEGLESANLTVVRSDRVDLDHDRRRLAHRMRDGYRRGLNRDRSRDAWTLTQPAWWRRRVQQYPDEIGPEPLS